MSLKRILRKTLFGLMLGARSLFGISMSSKKIEGTFLFSSNQPRAEETISAEENKENKDQEPPPASPN